MENQPEETDEDNLNQDDLYDADPNCDHEIISLWSGIKCRKCTGWFCY